MRQIGADVAQDVRQLKGDAQPLGEFGRVRIAKPNTCRQVSPTVPATR